MPRRFVPTEETCKQCEGSGENDWGDGDCSSCYGEGKEISDEYLKLFEVSASLTILFIWLSSPQIETGAATSQVMCVQTHSDIGMHGSSIGGAFSSELSSYLAVMPENTLLTEIKKATKQAYENMMGDRLEYFQDDFQSYVGENGYLVINCIGDACQVHNDTHSYDKGRSRGFTCHNVDNAEQQLTLLAGLGRLHRLFRNATQEIQDVAGSASS